MSKVIETISITKKYGTKCAVKDVSVNIERGEIYGLIGANGAGKTTLMKLILGLVFANKGEIKLFGSDDLSSGRARIGSLIEAPGLYLGDTAHGNLKRFGILTNSGEDEIQEILEFIGLANTGNKKVKAFSLGMKQRLGIGIALLGKPDMLVLDEPVNGLDPAGIKEVRDLLLSLNEKGVTVLISSHLIDELGKIATKFGIMRRGELVEEVTMEEIRALCSTALTVTTNTPAAAKEIISAAYPDAKINVSGNAVTVNADNISAAELNLELAKASILVSELRHEDVGLEDFFIKKM